MTEQQYSDIQRQIGKLEGLAASLPSEAAGFFYDTIEVLDEILEEIRKGKRE